MLATGCAPSAASVVTAPTPTTSDGGAATPPSAPPGTNETPGAPPATPAPPTQIDATGGQPDSDGDGVPDIVEQLAGTDPASADSNPTTLGDLHFVSPACSAPTPERRSIVFETKVRQADVYFLIDNSWSMGGQIDGVRNTLQDVIFPGLTAAIPDVHVGVGGFDSCPERLEGETSTNRINNCVAISNGSNVTDDLNLLRAALGDMTPNCGTREPYGQSVWLFATGDTSRWPALAERNCAPGETGYACVRPDSLPIVVVIGDEPYSQGARCGSFEDRTPEGRTTISGFVPTEGEVGGALASIGGKIVVMGNTARSQEWETISQISGSVDASGQPLLFPEATSGAMIGSDVVAAVDQLSQEIPLDLTARVRDLDDDGIDATDLIDRVEANPQGGIADPRDVNRVCVAVAASDLDGDGVPETFVDAQVGTPVCFDVVAATNTTIAPTTEPQVIRAAVDIIADGVTTLDTRTIYFLIPPANDTPLSCFVGCADSADCAAGEFCNPAGYCEYGDLV